jgi:hypothetical protein
MELNPHTCDTLATTCVHTHVVSLVWPEQLSSVMIQPVQVVRPVNEQQLAEGLWGLARPVGHSALESASAGNVAVNTAWTFRQVCMYEATHPALL